MSEEKENQFDLWLTNAINEMNTKQSLELIDAVIEMANHHREGIREAQELESQDEGIHHGPTCDGFCSHETGCSRLSLD